MTDKRPAGHAYVDEFTEADDAGVKFALQALRVFLGGHVVVLFGRDDAGHEWMVPNPDCPNAEVRALIETDWQSTLRRMEEWRPDVTLRASRHPYHPKAPGEAR